MFSKMHVTSEQRVQLVTEMVEKVDFFFSEYLRQFIPSLYVGSGLF